MAVQVSPGVITVEQNLTASVPAVSTTTGAIAGLFRWGPANTAILVSTPSNLADTFGKPTNYNAETYFSAENFLGYSNQLQVVRVYESNNANTALNAYNGFSNTATVSSLPQVDNLVDFQGTTLDTNITYLAKYPGAIGNSLTVSVCDSANAYSSNVTMTTNTVITTAAAVFTLGSNTATVTITSNTAGAGNTSYNAFTNAFSSSDFLQVGNSSIGTQVIQLSSFSAAVESGPVANVYTTTATINLATPYALGTSYSSNIVTRYWKYYNKVSQAPGVSTYSATYGNGVADQLHVVVVDTAGLFTGTPGTILETFSGLSRATDAKTPQNQSNYYGTVINNTSNYIWFGKDRAGATSGIASTLGAATTTLPYVANFGGGQDGADETAVSIGALTTGWNLFASKESIDVSLLIFGKARGLSPNNDAVPSSSGVNYSSLANYIIANVIQQRKDCVGFISPAKADVVNTINQTSNIIAFASNISYATSYAALDSGYKYQYDRYNDVYRWIPLCGDHAGVYARTDYTNDPWYSAAGVNRGQINNVVKLAFNPNQAQRDLLYQNYIDFVVSFPGQGTILFGDKTLLGQSSAFDRVNVRRLFIVMEKAIALAARQTLFEFNDAFTRNQFFNLVDPYLRDIKGRRGIYDYKIVCDSTNNTQAVIDANRFVADIYVKPERTAEFLQLNFIPTATGAIFSQIIGQVG